MEKKNFQLFIQEIKLIKNIKIFFHSSTNFFLFFFIKLHIITRNFSKKKLQISFGKWKKISINLIHQINFEAQTELNKTNISLNELNSVKLNKTLFIPISFFI